MVFMISYSSELPLNPCFKSIFGLPNAADALSQLRHRLSVATKSLQKKAESERRTPFQSGAVLLEARRIFATAARSPRANWRSFQREPLGSKPGQRHKDRTAAPIARDKLIRIKWKSMGKDGKMTRRNTNLPIRIPVNMHFML